MYGSYLFLNVIWQPLGTNLSNVRA